MTLEEMHEAWEAAIGEYLEFGKILNPPSRRPDLCAFLRLEQLLPGRDGDIVSCAEHDEIGLDVDVEALAAVISEDDVVFLRRCGVRYNHSDECLVMFV